MALKFFLTKADPDGYCSNPPPPGEQMAGIQSV